MRRSATQLKTARAGSPNTLRSLGGSATASAMMVRLLDRIDPERRQLLASAAESFLERATMVGP